MSRPSRRILPLAISLVLAACASVPPQTPHAPIADAVPVTATPPQAVAADAAVPVPATNVWDRLRDSFAMPDCNADPSVMAWAKRYTRNRPIFEETLRQAMPRLVLVQQIAEQYRVAGEFALLPWVESRYRPVRAHRHHAAGMWQIMPITARSMGLRVDRHYDGRLDMPAATHAVMKLLEQYHDRFHDWRVADYAYNTGEFRVRALIRQHGAPADEPVIPDLPVHRVTREHLTQLLAIACVIREPERFQVSLPTLPKEERLVQMPMTGSMTVSRAADLAGMPVAALRHLNPAFGGDTIVAPYLMLPAGHADQLRTAMQSSGTTAGNHSEIAATNAQDEAEPRTHVVSPGESLWQIAREYSTSVARLEQLNHLPGGDAIQPGQVLQVDAVD